MRTIVNGQRIVTEAEFIEAANGFSPEPLELEELDFTAGGLASRDALTSFMSDFKVENDTDREDAAYYRALLRRMPRELRRRTTAAPAVLAVELETADDALGFEDDDFTADWTAADFDSYEVLASVGRPNPAAAVTRARQPRAERRAVRTVLRLVRDEVQTGVAA
ncbi:MULTISPECIES: hypothetical protein [Streptomyces]|uniref:Uncharacterized protein n=1 Tax=Streptomyces tsukubensis (strain DSM 42081 / NBRC 108919 / NRRL 18488 / 9993) TaxID=1114943 RepID=I2MT13_STRT9|nr:MULTISPECIES: hypothetical protein [Streptomyces]AZK98825.1 hypothetical protein B7R87_33230 [Streptomyces tsukubensis]EIF87910.1 hypothetical protein [Streptomyces tsukubensis NRRL18488]MYS66038.1 hypothetical protein [Streptomyces sp. SID5473]QKM65823.1 hypothetical protein STSU_000275 [Streptomyces tsukubensis NRRL18488]